jgi:hypothetical protein
MQNIHAHARDAKAHLHGHSPQETDVARGFRIEMDVRIGDSALPRVSDEVIEAILNRDVLGLLGVDV